MNRLTMRLHDGKIGCLSEYTIQELAKKLADYEDAEQNGTLIHLPCRVGDTVYVLKFEGVWRIIPHQVKTLGYIVQLIENEAMDDFVFLTREAAEQALAKMKGV